MKKVSIVFLVIFSFFSSLFATSPTKYPKFEADTKIEIIGEPKLGKPFEVEFTFSPMVDCYHTRGIQDTAKIRFSKGVKFLEGDTVWTGFLEKGQKCSLRAHFVVDTTIIFNFKGVIWAMEVKGLIHPLDLGIKACIGIATQPQDFKVSKPIDKVAGINNEKSDSIPYFDPIILRNSFAPKAIVDTLITAEYTPVTFQVSNNGQTDTNFIYLDSVNLFGGQMIILYPKKVNLMVFPNDKSNGRPLQDSAFSVQRLNDNTFEIKPISSDTVIIIEVGDTTFALPVQYISYYDINGNCSYLDDYSQANPCKNCLVRLITYNYDLEEWELTDETYTDIWGDFQFWFVDNANAVVSIYSYNEIATLAYSYDHDLSEGDTLYLYFHH